METAARQIGRLQAQTGPLEAPDDETAIRCRSTETGWTWYYVLEDDGLAKYHEFLGFEGEPTARTIAAETVGFQEVITKTVDRDELERKRRGR